MSQLRRRVDDPLWKSIIEHTFKHFLAFFFPEAEKIFDFNRGFEYMDKEFEQLFPPETSSKGVRYVDKLAKVYLHDGSEKFVLCHIEVQSSRGKGNLAERMFQYFYRIRDKYRVPITAIAILADENRSYRPSMYLQEFMGTSLSYKFNSYKILDHSESDLRANMNPFAVVALTALQGIVYRNISDEALKAIKHDLYDEMTKRAMDKYTRQGIYDFLSRYVSFQDETLFSIFEREIETKIGRNTTMGTREYLLDKAKTEGKLEGKREGMLEERAKAEMEKRAIALEFKKLGVSVSDIARATGLAAEEIDQLV
ncbi:hypothetical protein [Sphingobacterium sp. LRF_L2]|uniref:hypothetical protein n=1 Tax=Sphingobacterium sp. LRF_L2 TaxID=3369421 RepID=UPI003F63D900